MKRYLLGLRGESNYQAAITRLSAGAPVELVHDAGNPHDARAVKAEVPGGEIIGYAPRDSWVQRALIDECCDLRARVFEISGGTSAAPSLGVVLEVFMLSDPGEVLPAFAGAEPAKPGIWDRAAEAALASAAARQGGAGAAPANEAFRWRAWSTWPTWLRWAAVIFGVLVLGQCFGDVKRTDAASAPAVAITAAPEDMATDVAGFVSAEQAMAAAELPAAPELPEIGDAYVNASNQTRCRAEYPDDLMMRGACVRNGQRGAQSFREIKARHAAVPDVQRALAGCLRDYTADGVTDFMMAGACARNNERALKDVEL